MDLTVKLLKPVTVAGHTTTELTLRELSVAENLALEKSHKDKTPLDQDVHFFALSTGVAPDIILAMGQRDWTRLKTRYWETLGNVAPEDELSV